jgi:murein DD-endopeptidase MepM/ murein hydrolase activator NlpD
MPSPFSAFNAAKHHFGTDYASKNEYVHAVAAGKVVKIGWDSRPLKSQNARSGLSTQGWGRYVLVHHNDCSESLYAHLEQDSTKALKVGQAVQAGDVLGKSDTTGGATGLYEI